MVYPFDPDDDEDTVELAWQYAEVCDYGNGFVYGIVKMNCMPGEAPWQQIFGLNGIGPQLRGYSKSGKLIYNAFNHVISLNGTKLLILKQADVSQLDSDCCPRCAVPGKFVRTALLCPSCGDFLGGF